MLVWRNQSQSSSGGREESIILHPPITSNPTSHTSISHGDDQRQVASRLLSVGTTPESFHFFISEAICTFSFFSNLKKRKKNKQLKLRLEEKSKIQLVTFYIYFFFSSCTDGNSLWHSLNSCRIICPPSDEKCKLFTNFPFTAVVILEPISYIIHSFCCTFFS